MISDAKIWEYIRSDIPLDDTTTALCKEAGIDLSRPTSLEIFTRKRLVLSGINVVKRICAFLECETTSDTQDSQILDAGAIIFSAKGSFENIHKLWKLAQILLEYSCKITTYTADMLAQIRAVSATCQVQTTRKSFPFAKEFCLAAVIAGGGRVHRANLSDSVLFFKNHINAFSNFNEFCKHISKFKATLPEKKIMVEVENLKDFQSILSYEPDVVQCDKMDINELREAVNFKNMTAPKIVVTAAGGINLKNCATFAATGIDAIITTAPYMQGACDLSAKINFI